MAPPLAAAWIGNGLETLGQQAHLFGIEHDLGNSCELKTISVGMGQVCAHIAAQRAHEDPFGCIGLRAVAFPSAAISLRQYPVSAVGRAIPATIASLGIPKP